MRKIAFAFALLGTTLVTALYTVPARAQATRTWVSGVGDDANPCSRTAPCKTFAGAISKTTAGGEIDALDPGGFGGVTITKSITLDGGGGQVASILVAGSNGITVSAGSNDVVVIRNMRFQGNLGNGSSPINAGLTAIQFSSGAVLSVENCAITGFNGAGIGVSTSANAILNVFNTTISNTVNGLNLAPTGGTLNGVMDRSTIEKVSANGITTGSSSTVFFTMTNSNIVNAAGVGMNSGGSNTVLSADSSSVTNNNTAFKTNGGLIRISRNVIYDNTTNYTISGGTVATTGDNVVAVNGTATPNGSVTHQ
jgi:hypothetical protein